MVVRIVRYLWAGPTTVVGLLLGVAGILTGGHARVHDGLIEIHGGIVRGLLSRAVPIPGGADAVTLGHVVLGRTSDGLDRCRSHEHVHVRQCERWGPAFIPLYLAASCWAVVRGRHAYRENWFERQARDESRSA
jgi:hypothetical protein